MTYKFYQPLSDEHAKALGIVVASWAEVEAAVDYLIWNLLDPTSAKGPVVTSEMRFLSRVDLLFSLARNHFAGDDGADIVQELQDIANDIEDARVQRNHLAHGRWSGMGYPAYTRTSAKRRWQIIETRIAPDEMLTLAKEMRRVEDDLYDFAFRHDISDLPPFGLRPHNTSK